MYTQCWKCETVFKVSAQVLRAANGQVRCGRCGEVFSALTRLTEDLTDFTTSESQLELEARADRILETVVALQVAQAVAKDQEDFAPAGVEIAHLEIQDWTEGDEPEAEEAEEAEKPEAIEEFEDSEEEEEKEEEPADRLLEFTLPPGELDRIFVAPEMRWAQPEPHPEGPDIPGFEVPEDMRREDPRDGRREELLDELREERRGHRRGAFILWLSAAILSTLLLAAQIVHQNREWIVAHAPAPLGAGVEAVYTALGAALPRPANLSAYQLRQWGITGDPDANGTLRLRASILNAAAQLQPYPLLRVTLADRFGNAIGSRDFEPAEYLGKPIARALAPGERVDATLEILDPGKNAEGFEIDVCLRGADRRVACQSDVAAQAQR